MKVNGKELVEGKFYLWNIGKQAMTGTDLHSVFFVTEKEHVGHSVPDKVYEVVFTMAQEGAAPANGWYLVEKRLDPHEMTQEGEVVESPNQEGGDLAIAVGDDTEVKAIFG